MGGETMSNDMEKLIIETVLQELQKQGHGMPQTKPETADATVLHSVQGTSKAPIGAPIGESGEALVISDEAIDMPDISKPQVENANNPEALAAMKKSTIARIGLGRSGTRQRTDAFIRFLADHAIAQDAVFLDVAEDFLRINQLLPLQSRAQDKETFLTKPFLGTKLSDESLNTLLRECSQNIQVQIVVADGLSSTAIERNIPEILPVLVDGLKAAGISVGKPVFVKNGRVRVMDHIGMALKADVVIELIGERPGLGTASSMSAYLIYRPTEKTVEADRTMLSNIHKGGTPPVEAGAQLVELIKQIIKVGATGVKLNQALK